MRTYLIAGFIAAALTSTAASAATMTFSGLTGSSVTQPTYTENGITATSIGGSFWGYPSGSQLHLDPSGFGNSTYDFTYSGGLFNLVSLDVTCCETTGALGTFTAFDAGNAVIGMTSFSAAVNGTRTFNLTGISRLRLVDTGSHFSIDNLVLNPTVAGAVPEPATWGLMLIGCGAVGYALRRRRKARSVAVVA